MKDLTWKIWHERFDPCALFWHERSNQFWPVQVCATDAVQKLIFEDMTACARSSGLRGYVLSSINISPPFLKYTSTLSRSDCCSFQVYKYTPSVRLMHFLSIQVILLGEADALFKYVSDPPGSNWCTFQICKWFPLVRLMHFSSLQVSMLVCDLTWVCILKNPRISCVYPSPWLRICAMMTSCCCKLSLWIFAFRFMLAFVYREGLCSPWISCRAYICP